uniref:Prepilin type IV endopeptidase peptidase domain-containing protein n=1 Tax=Triticum urartu TaxID=4572 RepID=A0A8R7TPW8_TRIUA
MLALSALVLFIAGAAIENSKTWWPELIHTSIVGITLLLLNMMWGSPFQRPSADSDTAGAALVGLAGYIAYILCSMALSYNLFGASLLPRTFTIGLTFSLLDVFLKPSSYSNMVATLGTITTALMGFLVLAAMSFLVFIFLQTWVDMLLPSAWHHHPARTFATIVSLTFVAMKAMLDVVDEPSVFSGMKAGLLGVIDMINGYHGAYAGIRNLTVLAVPLLSMESMRVVSMYKLYTKAALIVALGLVLTMP